MRFNRELIVGGWWTLGNYATTYQTRRMVAAQKTIQYAAYLQDFGLWAIVAQSTTLAVAAFHHRCAIM